MNIFKNVPMDINYGVVVFDLNEKDSDGDCKVIHFVGLEVEPDDEHVEVVKTEFLTENPEYLDDTFNIQAQVADEDVVDVYKDEYIKWYANQN